MKPSQALVPWLLLTALLPAVLYGIDTVELQLGARVSWNEDEQALKPRCVIVSVAEPGLLVVELATDGPSTAPGVLVLTKDGTVPETVQRLERTALHVHTPGEYQICLSSQAPLVNAELTTFFLHEENESEERDEDETELEPDP